jgi:hypothetical protein
MEALIGESLSLLTDVIMDNCVIVLESALSFLVVIIIIEPKRLPDKIL